MILVRLVVARTPFTFVVSMVPAVVRVLEEMTLLVALTPLIVVVRVLPLKD